MINTNIITSTTNFSGFKNYQTATFSVAYAGGNLAAGAYATVRATTPLSNSNSVSQIQIRFTGLESFYRILPGTFFVNYPSSAAPNYQIEVFSYFTSSSVVVDAYIVNETGGVVSTPAITFDCIASLYKAPF